ncbi:Nitrogen fixation protein VnfA [Novipirellula galeiformis]|uniref:Nitrogen fixation protein VnfA n=1 Tax=Novipirellula galeiformis TaxID=2528004 RepID=A0A5C6C2G4_9BACT|nr:sigma-54-dependent Fis family transcriptional regulator [Novipirellula galeiformis]TWU17424.1 Nitrogen fixation protein VnfA [Novipirellula galeiformis]
MTELPVMNKIEEIEVGLSFEILKALQAPFSRKEFLQSVLPTLLRSTGGAFGGLVSQRSGAWAVECWVGEKRPFPSELVGESFDRSGPISANGWVAVALTRSPHRGDTPSEASPASALVLRLSDASGDYESAKNVARIQSAANLLSAALQRVDAHDRNVRRIEQLSAVLRAAAQWQQLDDDEALLQRIADTATKLLHCERASIFLWDRRRKKLIGRPALGVEGKPLEVDDQAGVVGEVLRSGEAKLWNTNSDDDEARVNRSVDQSLEFQTHSLVAVPMSNPSNPVVHAGSITNANAVGRADLIGVFEAINHRSGAFDHLDMAVLSDLALHAAAAIRSMQTRKSLTVSRDRLVNDAASATQLIGNHPSIDQVRKNSQKVAATDLTVLVLGSNGTGKEVLARHIHYESNRRSGPFVAVNCAALVESLLESELFGHEKGSFTDASQTRVGKFELAHGGTLFLDEVGDMSSGGQAKLLRVLEEKVVVRVGGSQTIPVDVRVIAATNQPLEQRIVEKRFREDLFFRLNVVSLTLPSLSKRGDDILLLAEHFLEHFSYQIGRAIPQFDALAKQRMLSHPWPGNVRELRNTMERVCYLCSEDTISAEDLMLGGNAALSSNASRESSFLSNAPETLSDATRIYQVAHIERAIEICRGNMTEAAERLGLHRSNLYRKMRQLGMPTSGE